MIEKRYLYGDMGVAAFSFLSVLSILVTIYMRSQATSLCKSVYLSSEKPNNSKWCMSNEEFIKIYNNTIEQKQAARDKAISCQNLILSNMEDRIVKSKPQSLNVKIPFIGYMPDFDYLIFMDRTNVIAKKQTHLWRLLDFRKSLVNRSQCVYVDLLKLHTYTLLSVFRFIQNRFAKDKGQPERAVNVHELIHRALAIQNMSTHMSIVCNKLVSKISCIDTDVGIDDKDQVSDSKQIRDFIRITEEVYLNQA